MPPTPNETSALRDAYFARIAPLYGRAWDGLALGLGGDLFSQNVALLLARCGLRRFIMDEDAAGLRAALHAQNPFEDRLVIEQRDAMSGDALWLYGPGASRPPVANAWTATLERFGAESSIKARVDFYRPGESLPRPVEHAGRCFDAWETAEWALRVAALVRGWLLKDTISAPAEASILLQPYLRPTVLLGHARWPWWLRACERKEADVVVAAQKGASVKRDPRPGGRALVIGCGSVGSVAADALATEFDEWVLLDPETISIENPVRQAFDVGEVGDGKAHALARRLGRRGVRAYGEVFSAEDSRAGVEAFDRRLDEWRPDVALLATGTRAEYAMAQALRRHGIPHVAARCYARARYYELIVVDGAAGPCFHCLRERVHAGPAPALTPEQQARYDPDYRPGALNAEPATILESGRCALAAARIMLELARPTDARAEWFSTTLAQERTCLIGGNHAERARAGWAYGVERPGTVVSYGLEDLAGVAPGERCEVCGNILAAEA